MPASQTVTGEGFSPFPGFEPGTFGHWLKLVNRASGLCLTRGSWANGAAVGYGRCARAGLRTSYQMWFVCRSACSGTAGETQFEQGNKSSQVAAPRNPVQCLDVTEFRYVANTPLQGWRCQPTLPWNQRFRLSPVAAVSCEIGVTNDLCGLARRPP